jgi:acyl transferase domain-containing protein
VSGRSPRVVNDHELYHSKVAECREAGWAPEYEDFVVQLALAHCLVALGCDISIVGGEGMTEYLAAVFAGLIPPSAVFRLHGQTDRVARRTVTARCSRLVLDEYLTMWRADELRITGEHGPDRFTLRGTPDAVAALASEKDITVDLEGTLPPPTLLAPVVLSQPPRIPIVSSHLGEAIDDETVVNYDYWSNVQDRDMFSDAAWTAMASQCDVVVNLGLAGDICDVLKEKCVANHQRSLETLLGGLFDKGCVVDWQRFASKGPRAHLPPYSWATDEEYDAFKTSSM